VEYLFPYEFEPGQIADALEENGLTQALFNLPPGNWDLGERGLAALPDRREEFRASVEAALVYAGATQVKRFHVMSGLADARDRIAQRTFRESLDYLCDQAGQAGLEVMIEPINSRDMPGYFLNDFNMAADLISDIGHQNLKLQFDIYHRQVMHGDVLTALRSMMPMIGHIQIASVPGRTEPGTGELDDLRILRELDRMGYDGFVGCEYRPAGETVAGLGWMVGL
jgi:hydroxypyruvate isomerase